MLVLRDTAKAEASASGEDKKALRRQNRVSSALATIEEPDEGRKKKRAVPVSNHFNAFVLRRNVQAPFRSASLTPTARSRHSHSSLKRSASKRVAKK